jgi:hypothetical protein
MERIEKLDPTIIQSTTLRLKHDPNLAMPQTLMLEPNRSIDLTESEEDAEIKLKHDITLPQRPTVRMEMLDPNIAMSLNDAGPPART